MPRSEPGRERQRGGDVLWLRLGEQESPPSLAQVGGKALSLDRGMRAGLQIPHAAALTSEFFQPWYEALAASEEWERVFEGGHEAWPDTCPALVARASKLGWLPPQEEALRELLGELAQNSGTETGRFAVRSSSPEEDLAGASFAGGYETSLGVLESDIQSAVLRCFASSLAARVFAYKRAQGFDLGAPRIAVIIQCMVASEVAGVGFSLDPLTNDYDVAVFSAAWGLGETVVAGQVTPDSIEIDKVSGEVRKYEVGSKEAAFVLGPDGVEKVERQDAGGCLDAAQLEKLLELCRRVESYLGLPADFEWAFANDELWLLQARPITAWVPLAESMQTEPGERRRLYQDLGLAGGLTMSRPVTPLGQSWMKRFAGGLLDTFVGPLPVPIGPEDQLWFLDGGRMYQDLSNVLTIASPKTLAKGQAERDALMAATLQNIDASTYRAERKPSWARWKMLRILPRILWRTRGIVFSALHALIAPRHARRSYERKRDIFLEELANADPQHSIPKLIEIHETRVIRHVVTVTMPPLMIALWCAGLARKVTPKRLRDACDALERGHAGNVVVEMTASLFALASLLNEAEAANPEQLAKSLERGEARQEVSQAWRALVARFGWRGPDEVDLGRPRYGDAPLMAIEQVCSMAQGIAAGSEFSPFAAMQATEDARVKAQERIESGSGFFRKRILRWALRRVECFLPLRDDPKHHYLLYFSAVRRQALAIGRELVAQGRLECAEEVEELDLETLLAAHEDTSIDLAARRSEGMSFIRTLEARSIRFPAVIDSRGRIVRPTPKEEAPNTLRGVPVSPGVARGPVRALRSANERRISPGDVLVAHTTDPGWTPLFVNAAAVVLEVGGALQHGAVVAREFGKPCVVGIGNLLERLPEGTMVEVDGSAGLVRICSEK